MAGNSTVGEMEDRSTVEIMYGDSTVQRMKGNSLVWTMKDRSTVEWMGDNSAVRCMVNGSAIGEMYGNSIVVRDTDQNIHIAPACSAGLIRHTMEWREKMSKDLISRNELRKQLNLYLKRCNRMRTAPSTAALSHIIDDLPTAYDVDKVVEKLKELKLKEYDDTDEEPDLTDVDDIYDEGVSQGKYIAYGKSIEIVKAGGVNGQGITDSF